MSVNKFNPEHYYDPTPYETLKKVEREERKALFRPVIYVCSPFSGDVQANIQKALEAFLSDVYEPTVNESRWHFIESASMPGVEIKDDKFVYSHHAKDPAYLKLCNAFDIVRVHKFGGMDDKESYKAMCEFAMQQDDVKLQAANERLSDAAEDFGNTKNSDWMTKLKYQSKSGVLENSVYNLNLILNNDPDFAGFAYNEMANRVQMPRIYKSATHIRIRTL